MRHTLTAKRRRPPRFGAVGLSALVALACGRSNLSALDSGPALDDTPLPGGMGGGEANTGVGGTSRGGTGAATGGTGLGGVGVGGVPTSGGGGAMGGSGGAGGITSTGGSGAFAAGGGGGIAGTGGRGGSGGVAGGGGSSGNGGVAGGGGSSGNGGRIGCHTDADCSPVDSCSQATCEEGECSQRDRDLDGDGFVDALCGGADCNDRNPLANPTQAERCGDGADNDCNGVADCLDPRCAELAHCACEPTGAEVCNNGEDDDCDGALDCSDADCSGSRDCPCAAVERCGDGIDNDCNGDRDCDDRACAGTDLCRCQSAGEDCANSVDDDCDQLIDCADPGCASAGACACAGPPRTERCTGGVDEDCDRLIDCADPECGASPYCVDCVPETCNDGADNDCDGAIDCADAACALAPGCRPTAELCNNGVDDDHDGRIDCQDSDCANNPVCEAAQSNCLTARLITASGTYIGDTLGNVPETSGSCGGDAGEAVFRLVLSRAVRVTLHTRGSDFDTVLYVRAGSCTAGREIACDDDSGELVRSSRVVLPLLQPGDYFVFVDGFTVDPVAGPDEGRFVLSVDIQADPVEDCTDGFDNDGDVYADCADSDCREVAPCAGCAAGSAPAPEFGVAACNDGIDNDCDGATDCSDTDCSASPTPNIECCNGLDENDNGIADDFSCRCQSNADCIDGQICYTRSGNVCGIPCEGFVGDVCPFLAPGSVCNAATQQCEF